MRARSITARSSSRSFHPAHQRGLQPRLRIARGAVAHEARVNPRTAARTCASKPRSKECLLRKGQQRSKRSPGQIGPRPVRSQQAASGSKRGRGHRTAAALGDGVNLRIRIGLDLRIDLCMPPRHRRRVPLVPNLRPPPPRRDSGLQTCDMPGLSWLSLFNILYIWNQISS